MESKKREASNQKRIRVPAQVGKYKIIGTIGKGAFAVVALGIDAKTNTKVAVKILDREFVTQQNIIYYLENELRLCSRFNHPNIVKVYDIIYEPDIIMIVMEYAQNGDLQSLFNKGVHFAYEEQLNITVQILDALAYLHKRGISHRDIKPENILFDEDMRPKLIDFGLSKENSSSLQTFCGTPLYIAPEIVKGESYDGKKSDMWALGVTLNILACGKYPWTVKSEAQLFRYMQEGRLQILTGASGILGMIIDKCLAVNPNERPSSEELLKMIDHMKNKNQIIGKIKFQKKTITEDCLPKLQLKNVNARHANSNQQMFEVRSALNFKNIHVEEL